MRTVTLSADSLLLAHLSARAVTGTRFDSGQWGECLIVPVEGHGTLEIADREFSVRHAVDAHTGWSIFTRDANGDLNGEPLFCSGDGESALDARADAIAAADAVAQYIAARVTAAPVVHGPQRFPDFVRRCTGPNKACRAAHRDGRSVHIIPSGSADKGSLVLPTFHYETEEQARAAVEAARRDAVVIRSDEALFEARRLAQPYRLLPGWIDPSSRYGDGF
ncbi:hypothetical protein SAM9427_37045 (plasmid) [Streptomyces sp. ETH9427]|uniref:hypothetical protein n=1 Tax=Streptomyces sp. E1N211 TaxID=1851876 RepID=UPI000E0A5B5A|nr:hypothetical protein [Streptomyces sp. E1N211]AXI91376.1 hypothetical protein SAM9427_37045 [Streptomyces sp. ETH9427]